MLKMSVIFVLDLAAALMLNIAHVFVFVLVDV